MNNTKTNTTTIDATSISETNIDHREANGQGGLGLGGSSTSHGSSATATIGDNSGSNNTTVNNYHQTQPGIGFRNITNGILSLTAAGILAAGAYDYVEHGDNSLIGKMAQPDVHKIDVKAPNVRVNVPNQAKEQATAVEKGVHQQHQIDSLQNQQKIDSLQRSFADSVKVLSNPAIDKAVANNPDSIVAFTTVAKDSLKLQ